MENPFKKNYFFLREIILSNSVISLYAMEHSSSNIMMQEVDVTGNNSSLHDTNYNKINIQQFYNESNYAKNTNNISTFNSIKERIKSEFSKIDDFLQNYLTDIISEILQYENKNEDEIEDIKNKLSAYFLSSTWGFKNIDFENIENFYSILIDIIEENTKQHVKILEFYDKINKSYNNLIEKINNKVSKNIKEKPNDEFFNDITNQFLSKLISSNYIEYLLKSSQKRDKNIEDLDTCKKNIDEMKQTIDNINTKIKDLQNKHDINKKIKETKEEIFKQNIENKTKEILEHNKKLNELQNKINELSENEVFKNQNKIEKEIHDKYLKDKTARKKMFEIFKTEYLKKNKKIKENFEKNETEIEEINTNISDLEKQKSEINNSILKCEEEISVNKEYLNKLEEVKKSIKEYNSIDENTLNDSILKILDNKDKEILNQIENLKKEIDNINKEKSKIEGKKDKLVICYNDINEKIYKYFRLFYTLKNKFILCYEKQNSSKCLHFLKDLKYDNEDIFKYKNIDNQYIVIDIEKFSELISKTLTEDEKQIETYKKIVLNSLHNKYNNHFKFYTKDNKEFHLFFNKIKEYNEGLFKGKNDIRTIEVFKNDIPLRSLCNNCENLEEFKFSKYEKYKENVFFGDYLNMFSGCDNLKTINFKNVKLNTDKNILSFEEMGLIGVHQYVSYDLKSTGNYSIIKEYGNEILKNCINVDFFVKETISKMNKDYYNCILDIQKLRENIDSKLYSVDNNFNRILKDEEAAKYITDKIIKKYFYSLSSRSNNLNIKSTYFYSNEIRDLYIAILKKIKENKSLITFLKRNFEGNTPIVKCDVNNHKGNYINMKDIDAFKEGRYIHIFLFRYLSNLLNKNGKNNTYKMINEEINDLNFDFYYNSNLLTINDAEIDEEIEKVSKFNGTFNYWGNVKYKDLAELCTLLYNRHNFTGIFVTKHHNTLYEKLNNDYDNIINFKDMLCSTFILLSRDDIKEDISKHLIKNISDEKLDKMVDDIINEISKIQNFDIKTTFTIRKDKKDVKYVLFCNKENKPLKGKNIISAEVETKNDDLSSFFENCELLENVTIIHNNNLENCQNLFKKCHSLKNVIFENKNKNKNNKQKMYINCNSCFENCINLKNIKGIENFRATSADYMFKQTLQLDPSQFFYLFGSWTNSIKETFFNTHIESVDIKNLNNVQGLDKTFSNCLKLKKADCRNFISNNKIFNNCPNLTDVKAYKYYLQEEDFILNKKLDDDQIALVKKLTKEITCMKFEYNRHDESIYLFAELYVKITNLKGNIKDNKEVYNKVFEDFKNKCATFKKSIEDGYIKDIILEERRNCIEKNIEFKKDDKEKLYAIMRKNILKNSLESLYNTNNNIDLINGCKILNPLDSYYTPCCKKYKKKKNIEEYGFLYTIGLHDLYTNTKYYNLKVPFRIHYKYKNTLFCDDSGNFFDENKKEIKKFTDYKIDDDLKYNIEDNNLVIIKYKDKKTEIRNLSRILDNGHYHYIYDEKLDESMLYEEIYAFCKLCGTKYLKFYGIDNENTNLDHIYPKKLIIPNYSNISALKLSEDNKKRLEEKKNKEILKNKNKNSINMEEEEEEI